MPKLMMDKPEHTVFQPIEPGRYTMKVVSYELMAGKTNPGVKFIKWTCKITGEDRYNGRQVFYNSFYQGAKTTDLYKFLKDVNPDFTGTEFDPDDFIGKPFEADLEYKFDKRTNEISKYISVVRTYPYVGDFSSDFDDFK